jgi:hypothetical protein
VIRGLDAGASAAFAIGRAIHAAARLRTARMKFRGAPVPRSRARLHAVTIESDNLAYLRAMQHLRRQEQRRRERELAGVTTGLL